MKFKGHTQIELTDVNTGEVTTVEDDNFMTNAFSKMMKSCFSLEWPTTYIFSASDHYQNLTKFFGGLYLYDTNLGNSADTLYAPPSARLTGHGSKATYSGTDLSMGSYNSEQSGIYTDGKGSKLGYKFVWDFTQEQGNGTIACACLTTKWGGAITQGCKYKNSDSSAFVLDDLDKKITNSNYSTVSLRPYGDTTNFNENYATRRWPRGIPYIDIDNNFYYSFTDGKEFANSVRYSSSSADFKDSLIYKKSVTVSKVRMPCNNFSMFDMNGAGLESSAYDDQTKPSMKAIYVEDTFTIEMPSGLKSVIDTALARGSSSRYCVTAPTISDTGCYYLPIIVNEGVSGQSTGQRPGEHFYVWKIDFTTLTSSYYAVTNTANENIGFTGNSFGYSATNVDYPLFNGPTVVEDKYLFAIGYTSHKGYLIQLTNPTNIRTVKDPIDQSVDFVFGNLTYHPTGTCFNGKTVITNTNYNNGGPWNKPYSVSTAGVPPQVLINGETGTVEYLNSSSSIIPWCIPYNYYSSTPFGICRRLKDSPLLIAAYHGGQSTNTNDTSFHISYDPRVLMTINNLQSPVTKTSAQTMRVTYVITYEEDN